MVPCLPWTTVLHVKVQLLLPVKTIAKVSVGPMVGKARTQQVVPSSTTQWSTVAVGPPEGLPPRKT